MTKSIVIPDRHLVINKEDAFSVPALAALIKEFEPNLPDVFAEAMTAVTTGGNITGVHANATLGDLAVRIHRLYNDPDVLDASQGHTDRLSVVFFYNEKENLVKLIVGVVEDICPLEEGTFPAQKTSYV